MSLYFECHITIEPVFGDELEQVKEIAQQYKFRVADLLMKKRKEDSEERSQNDTFMTGHSMIYDDLEDRMVQCINELKYNKFKVWRYKIEDIVLDSRKLDTLGLLS